MSGRLPVAVDPATRANMLARLLGTDDPIQQLPAGPQRPGPQMMQGDPNAAPAFPPELLLRMQAMPPEQRRNLLAILMQGLGQ